MTNRRLIMKDLRSRLIGVRTTLGLDWTPEYRQQVFDTVSEAETAITGQPIATAPKDGARILGMDHRGWREMWWKTDHYEGAFWQDEFDSEPEPTHWASLPPL